jgi:hypothetical protein
MSLWGGLGESLEHLIFFFIIQTAPCVLYSKGKE